MRSIALLLLALTGALAFQGCGSSNSAVTSGHSDGGICNPAFCPAMGAGAACCASNNSCGFDHGNGCIATSTATDGGR